MYNNIFNRTEMPLKYYVNNDSSRNRKSFMHVVIPNFKYNRVIFIY